MGRGRYGVVGPGNSGVGAGMASGVHDPMPTSSAQIAETVRYCRAAIYSGTLTATLTPTPLGTSPLTAPLRVVTLRWNTLVGILSKLLYKRAKVLAMRACAAWIIAGLLAPALAADESIEQVLGETPITEDSVSAVAIQLEAGEYATAAVLAERAIGSIEATKTRYDLSIAEPLLMLGDARLALGDATGALSAYDRALHITRVNKGLHAPAQVEVVYREADAYVMMGDLEKANDRQEYAYQVLLRSSGASSGELIPALFRLAEWYKDTYNIFSARGLYEHAAKLAEAHLPKGDPLFIDALRGLAGTYRMERFPPPNMPAEAAFVPMPKGYRNGASYQSMTINNFAPGERALIYIIKMIQEDPNSTGEDMANALLELGDWFLLFEKTNRAVPVYQKVWSMMVLDPELQATTFSQPTALYLPLPGDPDAAAEGDSGCSHAGNRRIVRCHQRPRRDHQTRYRPLGTRRYDGFQGAPRRATRALPTGVCQRCASEFRRLQTGVHIHVFPDHGSGQ